MVKELSMDNSIFSLSANTDTNLSANNSASADEFQNTFEAAKNNYTDKKEFNTNADKVTQAAEKTIKREHNTEKTSTDVIKVNKKVSTHTETKSPETKIETTSQTTSDTDVNGVSDTFSFSMKEALNNSEENEESIEVISDTVIDSDTDASADVKIEATLITEDTETEAEVIASEIINFVAEKVTNITTSKENENDDDNESNVTTNLLSAFINKDNDTLLETPVEISETEQSNLLSDVIDTVLETVPATEAETQESESMTGAAANVEISTEENTNKIELGEGWEIVNEKDQKPLSEEELKNLVSDKEAEIDLKTNETVLTTKTEDTSKMNELNVEDVKPHSPEEIEAGKKQTEIDTDLKTEAKTEAKTEIKAPVDKVLAEEVETNIEIENSVIKTNTNKEPVLDNVDTEKSTEVREPIAVEEEISVDIDESEPVKSTKTENVDVKEVVENSINEISDDVKIKTETTKVEIDTDTIEEAVDTIITTEDDSTTSNDNETSSRKEEPSTVTTQNVKNEELDLDKLINDGIKLAYVDTSSSAKESDSIDVISALETKFVDSTDVETEVQFTNNKNTVEETVETQEQTASLEEVVDVAEFEELNVQLKDVSTRTNESTATKTNTVNSTTEQLIRFSIEGETGYEPNTEFTTFRTETNTAPQQATHTSAKEVLAQLSEKLSTFSLKAGSKLTMQLSPENLGKIEIKLSNTAQGIIAEMTVSSDETCDMMKKNLDDLKDTLQKYGVRFDNVTVKTSATQQSGNQQDYTEQHNNHKQQQEQSRENEKQKNKSNSFEDMIDSFTNEGFEE